MAPRYDVPSYALNLSLDLSDGFHAGPLFVVNKVRPPVRVKGKEGQVHRAQTKRATPKWLTDEHKAEIRAIYKEAKRMTKETGELHVVDHIYPKISPVVCGLHVPWNLRVIHWRPNLIKGNFVEGIHHEQIPLFANAD